MIEQCLDRMAEFVVLLRKEAKDSLLPKARHAKYEEPPRKRAGREEKRN